MWIQDILNLEEKIEYSIEELTDLFEKKHLDFLTLCKGENKEYIEWYGNMLDKLKEGELPYAFADYFTPTDYWETSKGQKIYTLPEEKCKYINY